MPKAFDEARERGAQVRTVTKGPSKGRLIAVGAGHPVLGHKRKKRRRRGKPTGKDFEKFM